MKNLTNNIFGYLIVGFIVFCILPNSKQDAILRKIEDIFDLKSNSLTFNTNGGGSNSSQTSTADLSLSHSQESIDYFNEITLGSEFGENRTTPFKRTFEWCCSIFTKLTT